MGAGLVKAALAVADSFGLDHAPTRLLVAMAVTAKDSDQSPAYWGGRDAQAAALGNRGSAGHRAVTRALRALSEAGLIETVGAAPGRPARYLLLDGRGHALQALAGDEGRSPSYDAPTKDAHRPTNEGRSAPNEGRSGAPTKDAYRPAQEKEEDKEEALPSRFCDRHPNGTSAPCGPCGEARKRAEAWTPPKRPLRPHTHRFDPVSGYCDGCELREDAA